MGSCGSRVSAGVKKKIRASGLGSRVGLGFRVWGAGFRVRVEGSGFRV